MLAVNALNLDQAKTMSFGKELNIEKCHTVFGRAGHTLRDTSMASINQSTINQSSLYH